jgi:hypothetical protein
MLEDYAFWLFAGCSLYYNFKGAEIWMYLGLLVLADRNTYSRTSSAFELEMVIEKLKRPKSPGTAWMRVEFIKAVGRRNCFISVNLLVLFGIRRICQKIGRSRSLYHFIRRTVTQLVVIMVAYHISRLSTVYKILSSILLSRFTPYARKYWCGFWHTRSTTDHKFCIHLIFEKTLEYNEALHQLSIDLKKASD